MTLTKIAKAANVSVSTVSKVFSGSNEISSATKDRVISVAKELGCFEKYYKPSFSKRLVAVICPELQGIHYSQMATYLEKHIAARGGVTLFSVSNFSADTQRELIDYYTKFANVDGIIVIEPVDKIKNNTDVPIIQIGLDKDAGNVHSITADISDALNRTMGCLARYGHSKIGFIGEKYTSKEYRLFHKAILSMGLGIDPDHISVNDHRFYDCGYYGMDEIIRKGNLPTAVFAAYSHIAVGILQRLNEEHLNVPEDISVICMDDINATPYENLELSCIRMHLEELCSEAIHLFFRVLAKRNRVSKHVITVERQFYHGESIKNLRG